VYIMYILHSPLSTITSIFVFPLPPPLFFFFRRSRSWWTHAAPASTPHAFASSETTSSRNSCVYDIPRAPTSSPTPLADILKSELFARFFLHILISEFFALFLIFSLYFKFFLLRAPSSSPTQLADIFKRQLEVFLSRSRQLPNDR